MKQQYSFVIIAFTLLFAANTFGQILNGGFEDWNSGKADHWLSTNIPNFNTNVTQTSDANSGASAVRGEVVEIFTATATAGVFSGYNNSIIENGFPVTQNYQMFTGYYKFIRGGSFLDPFEVRVTLTNESAPGRVAEAEFDLPPVDGWTYFEIPFEYDEDNLHLVAEVVHVSIGIGGTPDGDINIGSIFFLDDIALDGITDVELTGEIIPNEYTLKQNYPNPFNPTTNIKFSVPKESFVTLKVFNILGEKVATLVNENLSAGTYNADWDASNMPSGVYVYTLRTKNIHLSKKMVLLR